MAKSHRKLPEFSKQDKERFWSNVAVRGPDDCWFYTGYRFDRGYGGFMLGGFRWRAHRIAYYLTYHQDPHPLFACHKCDARYPVGSIDYRACCNPAHLFLGTQKANIEDAKRKGRMAIGDRNGARLYPERMSRGELRYNAVLSDHTVLWMRALWDQRHVTPITQRAIAKQIGASTSTVCDVVNRRIWTHV